MSGSRTEQLPTVAKAYGSAAAAYIEAFGAVELAAAEDRALIDAWGRDLSGPVLDAGCGPGHWSAELHALGLQVEGVDAAPEFVAHATQTHPDIPFRLADLRRPSPPDESLGGVLAWYSLIHMEPEEAHRVLHTVAPPAGRGRFPR